MSAQGETNFTLERETERNKTEKVAKSLKQERREKGKGMASSPIPINHHFVNQ